MSDREHEEEPHSVTSGVLEQVSTLVLAVIIALTIRAFVIEPYRIPSGSMFPTLLIGDHLFVNKFVYGVKIPFTDIRLPGIRDPARGDVIVFTVAKLNGSTFPADLRPELPREEFVKRIVGLPGDRLEFRGDQVYVNGELIESKPLDDDFMDGGIRLHRSVVKMGEHEFQTLDDPGRPAWPHPPEVIEEGRYFMMGDNRDHSKDSRSWGTVRLAEIKGPAFILYWSWDFNGGWTELINPMTWWELLSSKMRWERIGAGVS